MNYCFKRAIAPFLTLMLCVMCALPMFGQAVNSATKDVVQPSPNAASLGKYGDIPVGYYSGIPNIGVPIHTVKQGPLSVPIGLNYHAGGLKVGETSSWVGLGWSLQAGGIISRTVQGKEDEHIGGYFSTGNDISVQNATQVSWNQAASRYDTIYTRCIGTPNNQTLNNELASGNKDGEPDIFSFSVGGYSGKFYIDKKGTNAKGKVVLIPKQDVLIDYELTEGYGPYRLKRFTMTTPDGSIYEFGDIGDTNPAIEITSNNNSQFWTANSWYLKKIRNYSRTDSITFSYLPEEYRYFSRNSGHNSFNSQGEPILIVGISTSAIGGYSLNNVRAKGFRLNTINAVSETVTFIATENRTDLDNYVSGQEAKALSSVKIETGTFCKLFQLNQTYFVDNSADKSGQEADRRLKLMNVQEKSCDGSIAVSPHIFKYHGKVGDTSFLPNRFSSAIDHWGYYNGAATNPHYGLNIPYTRLKYYAGTTKVTVTEGKSNRETDEASMKLGTIQSITYPTGGSTTFDYEANSYWDTEGVKRLEDVKTLSRSAICQENAIPSYNIVPNKTSGVDGWTKTFATGELGNMYYKIEYNGFSSTPNTTAPAFCTASPNLEIFVYRGNENAPLCSASYSSSSNTVSIGKGELWDMFPCLQENVEYFFVVRAKNMNCTLTFQREITENISSNRKVGGLRIKAMTTKDGASNSPDIVKTYDYNNNLINTNRSSAVLYSKPIYSYIFEGQVGTCTASYSKYTFDLLTLLRTGSIHSATTSVNLNIPPSWLQTHFLIDQSIAPLSSFEGNHIGYLSVREYNGVGNGYSLYQYINEASTPSTEIPFPAQQPRLESGNLTSKAQRTANNADVSYEINEYKSELYEYGEGLCIKFNAYNSGPSSTSYSFWTEYRIRTKAFRLDNVSSFTDGVTSLTQYAYNPTNQHYNPVSVTTTNSDGVAHTSKTYYAHEMNNTALLALNMVSVPLKTEQWVNNVLKSATETVYEGTTPRPTYFKQRNRDGVWETKFTINNYNAKGLPTQATRQGFSLPETYNWDAANRLTSKWFGLMSSSYTYLSSTRLYDEITDENGFKTKFEYDALMRLKETKNYFADPAKTLRATTAYNYIFGGEANPLCNKVTSTTTFKDIAKTISANQIFDGLGRAIQSTRILHGPNEEHIKTSVTYDNLGRTDKNYHPFVANNINYAEIVPSGTLFVRADYELSPLSRPLKQYAEDGTFTTVAYGANTSAEVRKWAYNIPTDPENPVSVSADGYFDA